MTVQVGQELGNFRITGVLGAGGMGEVYRARDLKLDRDVALKVLPDVFASDKVRLTRFEREAKLLAALSHPNVAGIHDFGEANGTHFLVMELVEGKTLQDRLDDGAMSIDDALPIFVQIAEALETAHEHGIVHRDLKPANVKVTDDGRVKVLDFGLAKALEDETQNPALETTQSDESDPSVVTGEGNVLGTPAYMAPEQASGKSIDKRTDIWAYGCCLFESLAGNRPFQGSNATELLADIIKGEPDWDALPAETPNRVRILLWRCLQKDARLRLRDIGEARFELSNAGSDSGVGAVLGSTTEPTDQRRRNVLSLFMVFVLGTIASAIVTRAFLSPPQQSEVARSVFDVTDDRVTGLNVFDYIGYRSSALAISPDGSRIAYVADTGDGSQIYVRDLDRFRGQPLAGTEGGVQPFFSPNGSSIGFFTRGELKTVSLHGGTPRHNLRMSEPVWWMLGRDDGQDLFCRERRTSRLDCPFRRWFQGDLCQRHAFLGPATLASNGQRTTFNGVRPKWKCRLQPDSPRAH